MEPRRNGHVHGSEVAAEKLSQGGCAEKCATPTKKSAAKGLRRKVRTEKKV